MQVAAERKLLFVLQDLFAVGHDKIRVGPAGQYLARPLFGDSDARPSLSFTEVRRMQEEMALLCLTNDSK